VYQTRSIRFIGREDLGDWRLKVYGIGTHAPDARPEFVAATLEAARTVLPEGGGAGFVIAHDAKTAGLGLVYWWTNENEIHGRFFASPLDEPAALVPNDGTGLACVWEMEVLASRGQVLQSRTAVAMQDLTWSHKGSCGRGVVASGLPRGRTSLRRFRPARW